MKLIGNHDLQTKCGKFALYGVEHGKPAEIIIALKRNDRKSHGPWIVRIQYGCIAGTAFHSVDCDCARQLDYSLKRIAKNGRGLILYFPLREASGAGLAAKIRMSAEKLKSKPSLNAIAVNMVQTVAKSKDLKVAFRILTALKIKGAIDLLTNNPRKVAALEEAGVRIRSVMPFRVKEADLSPCGKFELKAKREFFNHWKF